jgi:hypothetical protein
MLTLRDNVGNLTLLNARSAHPTVEAIKHLGLDLNDGMVVIISGHYYHGADALHVLALLSSRSGLLNKLNYWLFKSKDFSTLLYPILRCGRNVILKLLGKTKIKLST